MRSINEQITDKLAELGIEWSRERVPDMRSLYRIGGKLMTTGEAADAYLAGGFKGNFGSMVGMGPVTAEQTSTDLAVIIAASPRFLGDSTDSRYFDEYAARYGRDVAGLAFFQACLKVDQDAAAKA